MFNKSLIVIIIIIIIIIIKLTRLLIFVLNTLGSFIIIAFDDMETPFCLIFCLWNI